MLPLLVNESCPNVSKYKKYSVGRIRKDFQIIRLVEAMIESTFLNHYSVSLHLR